MKSSKLILALWLVAGTWAHALPQNQWGTGPAPGKTNGAKTVSAPAQQKAPPAIHPAAPTKAPVAAPPRAMAAPRRASAPPRVASAPTMAPRARHAKASRVSGRPVTVAEAAAGTVPVAPKGRRDPFVSPVVERPQNGPPCTGSGRQCLSVREISLHGVVRSTSGSIAVIVNGDRTYFLRENDPLADGAVVRITPDAIVLRERTSDALGRPTTREVTKKLGVPAV